MSDKKYKSVEHQSLEKELIHSGKYGHKVVTSRKIYKRTKIKKELKEELESYDNNTSSL